MKIRLWICVLQICVLKSINCQIEPFIVGGSFASITRYPHSAFMNVFCHKKTGNSVNWMCGASVLNQRLLLTAAHCLSTCVRESEIAISVGHEHKEKGMMSSVHSFIVHDRYDPKTSAADIGLVRVRTRLKFSPQIRRVAVMKNPPYNEQAFVAGWGLIDDEEPKSSPYLKHIDQMVWSHRACMEALKNVPYGCLCASARKLTDYAASGDSGSALIVREFIQIGLVSFNIPQRSKNVVVYTDVGYYHDWIKSTAHRLYCI